MFKLFYFFIILSTLFAQKKIEIGIDRLVNEKFHLIKGKTIGIVANHTSILSNGEHLVDYLNKQKDVKIKAVFGPEHGFRGEAPDGKKIENFVDEKTNLPVISLYGKINKPTKEMLEGIDVLIFDIQDIGARFYTYISTMNNCLEAAAENNIKFIVCDRPNPIGGLKVDGPVLKEEVKSFVGIQKIPIQHGMTIGELAKMFNEEGWIAGGKKADLEIIKVIGWNRKDYFDELKIKFIKPSPNIINVDAEIVYPGMCLIEGTNISEGRGTYTPFLLFGAPFINSEELIEALNKSNLKGFELEPRKFKPQKIEGMTNSPKFENEECNGVFINVYNREDFESVKFGLYVIYTLKNLYKDKFQFREKSFIRLVGDEDIYKMLMTNEPIEKIFDSWKSELDNFMKLRAKYLLY